MWGKWSDWSECTKTCKFGLQSRTRKCNYPVPAHGGKDCEGPAEQSRKCNANVPCPGRTSNFHFSSFRLKFIEKTVQCFFALKSRPSPARQNRVLTTYIVKIRTGWASKYAFVLDNSNCLRIYSLKKEKWKLSAIRALSLEFLLVNVYLRILITPAVELQSCSCFLMFSRHKIIIESN